MASSRRQREELPDNDPEKWTEKDADGQPRDPWVEQWYLPLIGVENGDFVTFVTGSKGGIGAIARPVSHVWPQQRDGLLPIIALKTRSYKHKKYGRIEDAGSSRSSAGTASAMRQATTIPVQPTHAARPPPMPT